jgi:hypothetical protein
LALLLLELEAEVGGWPIRHRGLSSNTAAASRSKSRIVKAVLKGDIPLYENNVKCPLWCVGKKIA